MIQVHIDDRFEVNGLAVHIFERMGPGRVQIWTPQGPSRIEDWHEAAARPSYPFLIPREAAGPLFAALGRLLGSVENPVENPEALRRDYEAERGRVDLLIGAIVDSNRAGHTRG